MRCLITGGLGFIGYRLCRRLLGGGHVLRVVDNQTTSRIAPEALAAEGAHVIVGDVVAPEVCLRVAAGVDAIVHLAATTSIQASFKDPRVDLRTNVGGTVNLLEAARAHGVRKFVFASSNAVFGEQEPPLREDMTPRPVSPYGVSKLAAEGYCGVYHAHFGIQTACLRFANVYGPGSGRKESVVTTMVRRVLEGKPLPIYGDGEQTRDFTYVDDIVQAIVLALESDCGGETFIIGTGVETSVARLVETLIAVIRQDSWDGQPVRAEYLPTRTGDVRRNYTSIARAQRLLGYRPRVDLVSGVQRTWEWFRNNGRR